MASHQYNNKLNRWKNEIEKYLLHFVVTASGVCKYSVIFVLIFSMTFWAVVLKFFMLAVKIEFLLFGKMLFVYRGVNYLKFRTFCDSL